MPHYRLHFTHPDGVTTTEDYDSDADVSVGDLIEREGASWLVQEVEPFGLGYDGLVAVVPEGAEPDLG